MTKKEIDILEELVNALIHRMFVIKAIGKDQPIVHELDRVIEKYEEELNNT